MKRRVLWVLWVLWSLVGCGTDRRATQEDCRVIFERIVALEMAEMGFDDARLLARRQRQLAQKFASELERCEGRVLAPQALECIQTAATTEVMSHVCLR